MLAASIAGALYVACGVLAVPVVVLLVQVVAARRVAASMATSTTTATSTATATATSAAFHERSAARPSVAVLVPAHDEASGIAAALATGTPQLRAGDRLLVVADNCTDATAAVAASCGAEVVERHDVERRGKGYALDHGVRYLARAPTPPAVVLVVDADCAVAPGSVDALVHACLRHDAPAQALYLMQAPPGAALRLRIAEFAWAVRNEVRPRGAARLGAPCQLMGTGMAFPWRLIAQASLATGHIVEDMLLGLDLAQAGTPPSFCEAARVTSDFPTAAAAQAAQRTRWEHGHLALLATRGLPLLGLALLRRRAALAAMALDLCVPPLASLTMLVVAFAIFGAALAAFDGRGGPLAVSLLLLASLIGAVLLAWSQVGRRSVSLRELLAAPLYALAKVPIYLRLLTARQMRWVRTARDEERR